MAMYKTCKEVLGEDASYRSYVGGGISNYDVCVFGKSRRYADKGNLIFSSTDLYSSFVVGNGVLISRDVVVSVRDISFSLKLLETEGFTRDNFYYRLRLHVGAQTVVSSLLSDVYFNLESGEYVMRLPDFSGVVISGSTTPGSVFLSLEHLVNDTAPLTDFLFHCRITVNVL